MRKVKGILRILDNYKSEKTEWNHKKIELKTNIDNLKVS